MATTQLQRIADEIQARMETWVDEYGEETTVRQVYGDWEAYIGTQHMHMGLAPGLQGIFSINTYLQPREAIIGASVVISERKLVAYWVCNYEDPKTSEDYLMCYPLFSVVGDLTRVRRMDDFLRLHAGMY